MRVPSVTLLCLLLSIAGCTNEPAQTGDDVSTGKADDFAETDPDPAVLAQLVQLLRADGAIRLPPPGREFGATDMTVTVELVPVPDDDLRPIVREHVCDIGKRYQLDQDPCGANFPLYAHPDTHVVYQAGFVEKAIRTYLLSSLVSKEHRPAIAAIVNRFAWTFVRLTMFDSGAEIIGDDLIILHSCCSDQAAVVVRISYFAG